MSRLSLLLAVAVCCACGDSFDWLNAPSEPPNSTYVTVFVGFEGDGGGEIVVYSRGGHTPCRLTGVCTSVQQGREILFRANADSGSVFTGWSGSCIGTDDCVLSPERSVTAIATFQLDP